MKKFKISMLALLAMVIGIVASSFTVHQSPKTLTDEWFIYKGTGLMTSPGSYDYQGSDPGCPDTNVLCAIKVEDDGGAPDQSALTALYNNNGHFTQPVAGKVEFRDQ